jgi:disulfide bond formation protein DsbB
MNYQLIIRNRHAFLLMVTILSLFFAYGAEYLFHIDPCSLCIYQRYVYWSLSGILLIHIIDHKKFHALDTFIYVFLMGGALLSLYHVGVEEKIFGAPQVCSISWDKIQSVDDLERSINKSMPSCDQINWRILGISATLWNLSLQLFLLGVHHALKSASRTIK